VSRRGGRELRQAAGELPVRLTKLPTRRRSFQIEDW
jgi:hypothetical protein